ncbi:sugar porter family MFS transporter [Gilvimarinus sp. SDUM040013]|uniref:Sugar porter family MFS transporter n=1 Tax=Gilvimarinus gilvus TaxID=3058038 RepID=A0ABU4S0H1_9GAMM|nr:sugar porter family MFS transporter [Gilvimarinus sp. SDUM040013]MDO3385900.1 sugar porter family MFS transporter [Gilvimarinus sp. SDUM040013]MDX6850597.1 sugar porter family MFS transporter [Gilvimarinus sp. SDUM040013]
MSQLSATVPDAPTGGTAQTFRLAIVVALGGFLFGFDASVISGAINAIAADFALSDWEMGLVVASPTLGGIIAGGSAGPLSDRFGRKPILLLIAILYTVSAAISALAPDFLTITLARFIGGLGFGSLSLAPIYIAEISHPSQRGRMVSINQLNIVVGFSAAYFANYALLSTAASDAGWVSSIGLNSHTWRWMLGIELIPASLYVLMLLRIPESPRWLVLNNQTDRALKVIRKLTPGVNAEREVQEIRASHASALEPFFKRLAKLMKPSVRLALVVGLVLGVAQQITGVNAIYFYAPTIFEQSGVGTNAAFAQAIWVGLTNVVFTLVAMFCIDRYGRRPLLLVGLFGVILSMVVCAYGFKQATFVLGDAQAIEIEDVELKSRLAPLEGVVYETDVAFKNALREHLSESELREKQGQIIKAAIDMQPTLILIGILGFVASFAVSLGPVMWVLLSEIFPNHLRGVGMALIGVINSAVSFLVQFIFPWQLSNWGSAITFLNYGVFAVIGLVLVYWLLPETKGKTLEELEADFTRGAQS